MAPPESMESLARRNLSAILKAMSAIGQVRVAESIGVSPATVSRMKDENIEQMARLLAACNLVVQPRSFRSIDPDKLRALRTLARESLERDDDSTEWGSE